MKAEVFKARDLLGACEYLATIPSGGNTLVLMTERVFNLVKSVGSEIAMGYKFNEESSANVVTTYTVYGTYKISTVRVALVRNTDYVGVVAFNYKEFEAKNAGNVYVIDLEG